jgi:ubiquinone/menaquinone biosynthesis C-methylase UbiE
MAGSLQDVAAHYRRGTIEADILAALRAAGKDIDRLTVDDLAPIDEFHIGGREATESLVGRLPLRPDMHLLDLGSGIGGPARHVALTFGCRITGVELTDEFVEVASSLTRRVGLADRIDFVQGDAADLPFPDASFDGAYMVSVASAVPDKAALFAGVRRVLKPGAPFAVSEVVRGHGDILYPLPWTADASTNLMATLEEYRQLIEQAGFSVSATHDRTTFALEHFARMAAALDAGRPTPVGLHVILGPNAAKKTSNLIRGLRSGAFYPAEIVAHANA